MVSIRPGRGLIAAFFCLFLGVSAFSQTNSVSIASEIAALEKKASDSKLSTAERKQSLEKMARLLELSGNVSQAADAWERAALAVPGAAGFQDLLQSARCLAVIGEFDRANATLKPVLGASGPLLVQARLLGAWIEAFKTGQTGGLNTLLSNPDFAGYKPGMYYAIWRISGDSAVRNAMAGRLLAEFPQSPEARIVRDDPIVSAVPAALWLLSAFNQADQVISQPVPEQSRPTPPDQGQYVPAWQTQPEQSKLVQSRQSAVENSGGPVMLQTGLFSREDNARSLAERLRKAGFSPVVAQKVISGSNYWVVGVQPGPDPSRTMLLLKDRGFESFLVY